MKAAILPVTLLVATLGPAQADQIPLGEISSYLDGIETAQSSFTQINADGTITTGNIYIHRPGRARFEYDGDELLVMAGGGQLAIFDGRSNSSAEQYPLRQTPLSIILGRNVDLSRNDMVVGHYFDGTSTSVVAQDPDRPEIGTLTMVFTPDPVELRQWVVTDQTGSETTLVLGALETGERPSNFLFDINYEIRQRRGE